MSVPEEAGTTTGRGSVDPAYSLPAPRGNVFFDWLLVRAELARAHQRVSGITAADREFLRRAKVAFELGEFALAPGGALRSGSGAPLACDLFCQSLYWALRVGQAPETQANADAVWARADSSLLSSLVTDQSELTHIATAFHSTFVELAEGAPEAQRVAAERLQRAASRLITNVQSPEWQLEWANLKRLTRVLVLAVACIVLVVFAGVALTNKPDLAKGKPWRTSSSAYTCHPEKSECGGTTTDILFHTALDDSPWFEYDFGAPLAFSSLTVRNRTDWGLEMAIPLIAEVSNDGVKYKEIARRTDSFVTWRPSFATQHARYLRLRVGKKTYFHLEAIKVHP